MKDGYLRGALPPNATRRQMDVLAAYVAASGSVRTRLSWWASGRAPSSATWQTSARGRAYRRSS